MALDWNKEVTLSNLMRRSAVPNKTTPDKRHINLMPSDKRPIDMRKFAIAAIIMTLAVGIFAKFGVWDFYSQLADKQTELVHQEQTLSQTQLKLKDYNSVLAEYESYSGTMNLNDDNSYAANDILDLIDETIAPKATILSANYDGESIALMLSDIDLADAGNLAAELRSNDMVSDVSVSTASTQGSAGSASATMSITLASYDTGGK